jgi:hypothetical protein
MEVEHEIISLQVQLSNQKRVLEEILHNKAKEENPKIKQLETEIIMFKSSIFIQMEAQKRFAEQLKEMKKTIKIMNGTQGYTNDTLDRLFHMIRNQEKEQNTFNKNVEALLYVYEKQNK